MKQDNLLAIGEAAAMLKVHPETLRRWDNEGLLSAIRINDRGDRRWRKSDILAFLQGINPTAIMVYKGHEIIPSSSGFEGFMDRFGAIAKYIAKKRNVRTGFVFAVSGMTLLTQIKPGAINLKKLAMEAIKRTIDRESVYDEDVYTFEFKRKGFIQVLHPEWWEGPLGITLVRGLRVLVGSTHPLKEGAEAWRSVVRFKVKQGDKWLTNVFGLRGEHSEYYVEVSDQYLEDEARLPLTLRGAATFALKYIKKRFEGTKGKDGNRSIKRITENKVACWNGRCIRSAHIPLNNFN